MRFVVVADEAYAPDREGATDEPDSGGEDPT